MSGRKQAADQGVNHGIVPSRFCTNEKASCDIRQRIIGESDACGSKGKWGTLTYDYCYILLSA